MPERPMLFNGPMVRAILEGRKTVTRRLVEPQPALEHRGKVSAKVCEPHHLLPFFRLQWEDQKGILWQEDLKQRVFPGDTLWVRETWAYSDGYPRIIYRVNAPTAPLPAEGRWRPSIHMPRWACRLLLPVVSVRAEFLQDITEEEAIDEGFEHGSFPSGHPCTARDSFLAAWDRMYPHLPAASNPVVWRIEFRRERRDA